MFRKFHSKRRQKRSALTKIPQDFAIFPVIEEKKKSENQIG